MNNAIKGIVAGFVATLALSVIMMAKSMIGVMPQLNVISMLGSMMNAAPAIGWLMHFVIGTIVWGLGFAFLRGYLPGHSYLMRGAAFGIAAWLLMMLMVMPMTGAGIFGMKLGMATPIMALMLHGLYGSALGSIFGLLTQSSDTCSCR